MIRVLYVDDEMGLLELTKTFLECSGELQVDTSSSVKDAERMLLQTGYDAIICDYQMPETNGIEFLKRLRSRGDLIPFILFTGRGREEVVIEALNSGADSYVQKGGSPKAQFADLEHKVKDAVHRRVAEEGLIISRIQLEAAMDMADLAYWDIDLNTLMFTIEDNFWNICGTNAEQENGYKLPLEKFLSEIVHPDDTDIIAREIGSGGTPDPSIRFGSIQYRIVRRDGAVRQVMSNYGIIRNAEGRAIAGHGATWDITERKRAEEALQETEESYSRLVNFIPDPIIEMGLDGTIKRVNSRALEMSGYSRRALIGSSILVFIAPEDAEYAAQNTRDMVRGWLGPKKYDLVMRDHSQVPFEANGDVLRRGDGSIYGFALVGRDISEHVTIEEELKASKLQLTLAMEMAHLAYWEYDPTSNVCLFNDRFYALYGTSSENEGGYSMSPETYFHAFVHPDDLEYAKEMSARAASFPGSDQHLEYRIIRRDGEVRFISIYLYQMKDENGKNAKVFGVNQDITGMRSAKESLRKANEKLNLLNSITLHDIKNQLVSLEGNLSLLRPMIEEPKAIRRIEQMGKAAGMIEREIEFAEVYQRLGTVAPSWQMVGDYLLDPLQRCDVDKLEMSDGVERLAIYADPMLSKVLSNLMDNSAKHGGEEVAVRIGCREDADGLLLTFEDDGRGVPLEEKDRIFHKGYGKGTGLGLFLSKEILAITDITIKETGRSGQGARFEMLIPRGRYRFASTSMKPDTVALGVEKAQ
jgi:PAS domain S-box-containing protein